MLFTACPQTDYKIFFIFYNNSENDVYVYLEHTPKDMYSDTISKPQYLIFGPIKKYMKTDDCSGISFNSIPNQDTVYIFVLSNIDTLYNECEVLQRYNLSLDMNELKNRSGAISYPPDENMKDVKMYPSYGTYIKNK
jgi:hypothetical protein